MKDQPSLNKRFPILKEFINKFWVDQFLQS
jgi:hypothetical protein